MKGALYAQHWRICAYCSQELNRGDWGDVEHFRPKDLYPEFVFVWSNYFYACGPCNGPKNNQFSVIDGSSQLVDITRPRGGAIVAPARGDMALIDPRRENPPLMKPMPTGPIPPIPRPRPLRIIWCGLILRPMGCRL